MHFCVEVCKEKFERYPSHKCVLASGSDVFHAMFYGPMKEEGDIKIVDASVAAFFEFLQFFYCSSVDLSMENVGDVLNLGKKYEIDECVQLCTRLMCQQLKPKNVFEVYALAVLHEQHDLVEMCEKIFRAKSTAVFKSSGFLKCSKNVLSNILNNDVLTCSETEVFKACMGKSGQRNESIDKGTS